ncbi:DUF1127 domain-containing protein [Yoonia sp. MH D7]
MNPILFSNGFLLYQANVLSKNPNRPERNRRFQSWMRIGWEKWKHRKMIATLNALDDHTLKLIGIPRRHIKRFADNLCGVDSKISAPTPAPNERFHGQSRLKHAS